MVKMELRPEQLRTFQATGYLVLPSLVDEPTLRAWRAQIWSAIGADAAEPSSWPHRRGTPSPAGPLPPPARALSPLEASHHARRGLQARRGPSSAPPSTSSPRSAPSSTR